MPDGRHLAGLVGRLVELLAERVPTTCLSMYLCRTPNVVIDAVAAARAAGLAGEVHTIAKAVGSDVTNVIRSCLSTGRFGAAAVTLTTYLAHDEVVAVSEYTREQIVVAAEAVDRHCGTRFAPQCRDRVTVSYPPIDAAAFLDTELARRLDAALARRGLERDGYVCSCPGSPGPRVSTISRGLRGSRARDRVKLVIAGTARRCPRCARWPRTTTGSSSSTTWTTTRSRC